MNLSSILFNTPDEAEGSCIGLIGGGGKTTLLQRLGQELSRDHKPVILTALTKSGTSTKQTVHLYAEFENEETQEHLLIQNPLFIMGEVESDEKLVGVTPQQLETLYSHSALTIFECDGARKRPIKAHQPYDPAVPDFATHAIVIVGADAVGAKVDGKLVHRPELFRELWEVNANYSLEPAFIAKVLTSAYGYMQKIPASVKTSYLVNKADIFPDKAHLLAQAISRLSNFPVFSGSLEKGFLERIYAL